MGGNHSIIERIFVFSKAVQTKNDAIATALNRAAIPLLEYSKPLVGATREQLLSIKGVGPKTIEYIERIIAGDEIETVLEIVPEIQRLPQQRAAHYESPDRGNWDGSWDNTVRQLEGD